MLMQVYPTDSPNVKGEPCVNLKTRFGRRYKVAYEESYRADHGNNGRAEDPWLMILPCRNGHICPWGGSTLAACTNRAGPIAKRLKALPFTTVAQEGSDGANVLFDVEHFEEVAQIMQPRRRRRQSEEQRRQSAERLRQYQFTKADPVDSPAPQLTETTPECVPATSLV